MVRPFRDLHKAFIHSKEKSDFPDPGGPFTRSISPTFSLKKLIISGGICCEAFASIPVKKEGANNKSVDVILRGDEKMKDNEKTKNEGIQVKISPNADEGTKQEVLKIADLFEGPLFAKMVRDAVEEMILEGKLAYDLDTDEFDVPEDIVKEWASRMEKEVWSKKRS